MQQEQSVERSIFNVATQFHAVHDAITYPNNMVAKFALTALTSELYLKCLQAIAGRKPDDNTHLNVLFAKLPDDIKAEIVNRWQAMRAAHPMSAPHLGVRELTLEEALREGKNGFEEFRYFYKTPPKANQLLGFDEILRDVILELRPEWGRQ
jgi:hypothetical protein